MPATACSLSPFTAWLPGFSRLFSPATFTLFDFSLFFSLFAVLFDVRLPAHFSIFIFRRADIFRLLFRRLIFFAATMPSRHAARTPACMISAASRQFALAPMRAFFTSAYEILLADARATPSPGIGRLARLPTPRFFVGLLSRWPHYFSLSPLYDTQRTRHGRCLPFTPPEASRHRRHAA